VPKIKKFSKNLESIKSLAKKYLTAKVKFYFDASNTL